MTNAEKFEEVFGTKPDINTLVNVANITTIIPDNAIAMNGGIGHTNAEMIRTKKLPNLKKSPFLHWKKDRSSILRIFKGSMTNVKFVIGPLPYLVLKFTTNT